MIENNKYTPKIIVEEHLSFRVPLYQRLFAWTPKEVTKLLSDLKEHFSSERFNTEHNPYYLGLLTTIRNRNGQFELIDGQQRFTVMLLLAIAFKDIKEWKEFLDRGMRLELAARTEDQQYLINLVTGKGNNSYINRYMDEALTCIKKYINKEFANNDNLRNLFALNIFNYLTFFISELPSKYFENPESLNKYFEVMNSTGRGLEQHEILKVELIRNQKYSERLLHIWNLVSMMDKPLISNDNEDSNEYAEKYLSAINCCKRGKYDEALSYCSTSQIDEENDNLTIGMLEPKERRHSFSEYDNDYETSIINFVELLLLTLDLTIGGSKNNSFYQNDKLIERFKENPIEDINVFYNNLLYYRLLLDYYVIRRNFKDGIGSFFINYIDSDNTINSTNNKNKIRQYQSMLSVSTEYYIWLKPYMKYLISWSGDIIPSANIISFLKQNDNSRHLKDGYPICLRTMEYPNIDRYWFWRLDYYLWERCEQYFNKDDRSIVKEYVFRSNRSIEHLHPQEESENEIWDQHVLNGFGNLAMISQSFNSLQSNDNVRVKFARIQAQIDSKSLQSLKMLRMFRDANEDHSKWNELLAQKHLDEMCKLLEESFEN